MKLVTRRIRFGRPRTSARYDVVFYTPFIGWMLSTKSSSPPGGAETQILRLAIALVRRGVRVGIVAYGEDGDLPAEVEGVQIIRRPPYKANKALVGKLLELFRICAALRRAPSDAVVYRCSGLELGLIAAYVKLSRRRMVFSVANIVDFDYPQLNPKRRDNALYRLGVRLSDVIVVQTQEQVALCRRAFRREPVVIHSLASARAAREAHPEAFLWVGRLVSYKRPQDYLALARAIPEATFWMVAVPANGDERERSFGRAVVDEAERIPNLELLPPRSQPEIERLMSRAVASVNTAEFEGMPNVLLEAWAQGVPALVLKHDPGGVVTRFGLGGFADGSLGKMVSLAEELWETRHRRSQQSERCLAYIATHHAPDVVAEQWQVVLAVDRTANNPALREAEFTCAG